MYLTLPLQVREIVIWVEGLSAVQHCGKEANCQHVLIWFHLILFLLLLSGLKVSGETKLARLLHNSWWRDWMNSERNKFLNEHIWWYLGMPDKATYVQCFWDNANRQKRKNSVFIRSLFQKGFKKIVYAIMRFFVTIQKATCVFFCHKLRVKIGN